MFEDRLTDCRQCPSKRECLRNPDSANDRKGHGRLVSFMLKHPKSATEWMKRRIDSQYGKRIYGHRMSTVEPVFGNIGTNKGLNRFSLRGKGKVQGQYPKRFTGQALAVVLHGSQYREDHELRNDRVIHRDIHKPPTKSRTRDIMLKGLSRK